MKPLSALKPTAAERKKELAYSQEIIDTIKQVSGKDAMLVGSIAKDTCLRGDKDFDIFIFFDKKTSRKQLEKKGLGIARKVCKKLGIKAEKHYAEHPYIKSNYKGYDLDLVPCYKLKPGEKILSAVDRSPLHSNYVNTALVNKDEARKLKHFCKRIGVYGAEIKTHGFSGYLCELLIIKYGWFMQVLQKARSWEEKEVITFTPSNEKEVRKKFHEPLIVVDPVDSERNVAAAVSLERMSHFVLMARSYLKRKKIPERAAIASPRSKIFVVEWDCGKQLAEIIWSQLQRFEETLLRTLDHNEFRVTDSFIWTDSESKAQLLLEMDVWALPPIHRHEGPRVFHRVHADSFVAKHKKVRVEGDRIVAENKRKYTQAEKLIRDTLKRAPSHLKKKRVRVKKDSAAKRTQVYKEYKNKLWKI